MVQEIQRNLQGFWVMKATEIENLKKEEMTYVLHATHKRRTVKMTFKFHSQIVRLNRNNFNRVVDMEDTLKCI